MPVGTTRGNCIHHIRVSLSVPHLDKRARMAPRTTPHDTSTNPDVSHANLYNQPVGLTIASPLEHILSRSCAWIPHSASEVQAKCRAARRLSHTSPANGTSSNYSSMALFEPLQCKACPAVLEPAQLRTSSEQLRAARGPRPSESRPCHSPLQRPPPVRSARALCKARAGWGAGGTSREHKLVPGGMRA